MRRRRIRPEPHGQLVSVTACDGLDGRGPGPAGAFVLRSSCQGDGDEKPSPFNDEGTTWGLVATLPVSFMFCGYVHHLCAGLSDG